MTLADNPRTGAAPVAALLLLAISALAWLVTVHEAATMGNGPGPMGLGLPAFLGVWLAMVAAMMFPVVAGVVSSPVEPLAQVPDTVRFGFGYLAPWLLVGAAAYPLSRGTQVLAEQHGQAARALAAALFVGCATYQLSPWKERALRTCARATVPGGAPLRAGWHYGTRCVAASWHAMALFLALGFMHTAGTVVVAVWLVVERMVQRRAVILLATVALLVVAVAIAVHPSLAPGLHPASMDGM